jgi:short-subunit dehydrogenase
MATRPVALVTGASSGIGNAFATELAARGYDLVVVARDGERLKQLATALSQAHGTDVEVLRADLLVADDVASVERRLSATGAPDSEHDGRPVDLLVNNAGFGTGGNFHELPLDAEIDQIELNVVAVVRLTHAALGAMVARRAGSVINVASIGAFQPSPKVATYSATKAFVLSFTEAVHEELAGTGVKVMALCPGFTRTEFQDRAGLHGSAMPNFVWQSAEQVVAAALRDLEHGRALCVPGPLNKATASFTRVLPRVAVRKMAKVAGERLK